MPNELPVNGCEHNPKRFRLTIDGGLNSQYILELCFNCYHAKNVRFIIKEDILQ